MRYRIDVAGLALVLLTGMGNAQTTTIASQKTKIGPGGVPEALIALEQGFWSARKTKEASYFEHHLASQSVSIDSRGIRDRSGILKAIKSSSCTLKGYSLRGFETKVLGRSIFLLTYKADQQMTCAGHEAPRQLYASSLYMQQAGRLQRVFHQETPGPK